MTTNTNTTAEAKTYEDLLNQYEQLAYEAYYEAKDLDLYHHYKDAGAELFYALSRQGWSMTHGDNGWEVERLAAEPNPNLGGGSNYTPTEALNEALNRFDATISETFGEELGSIEHFAYTERLSLTTVRFADGGYISYRVRSGYVVDDCYHTTGDRLRRGMRAFGLVAPSWCYRS